jgi:hypothetical protein
MNNNLLFQFSSLAVCIPLFIGCVFIKRIEKLYYPFLYLIALALVTEISNNFILSYYILPLPANILILGDAVLITWALKKWGLYNNSKKFYRILLLTIILLWVAEAFIQSQLHHDNKPVNANPFIHGIVYHFNRYFNIFYSFLIVWQSIAFINHLANKQKEGLSKQPLFIICTAFIFLYSLAILHSIFLLPELKTTKAFKWEIWDMMSIVYLTTYLLYTYAVISMAKEKFVKYKQNIFVVPPAN